MPDQGATQDELILTPDQRLRVFISSCLQELSQEREAVRRAVETLHMTPVMFELGARPYPPRSLYRAYLAHSEVFIGIYWQSYGWVSSEMDLSGIEDEFRLAHEKPRLVYVKEPAPQRDPKLAELLTLMESEGALSYKRFSSHEELEKLVANDLALLVAERFQRVPEGTVTVLFTDVVGSTDLTTRLGDDAAREVLRACDELVRQQVARHRGQEVKHTGDGLMVAFQSARRAVACAVDIQRAISGRNRREPERAVRVRIGLNTGEVIREEADLFGATVTAAARIANHADAGEILISETAKGVLGEATTVQLEDLGEVELKGFPRPMRLHRVSWEEAMGPAGLRLPERTPFVGRESERAELRRLLEETIRGQGALVMIGGEPGVGKTRLAEELLLEARQRGILAWTGHCYEMEGAPPYIPFVEILEASARTVPPETLPEVLGDSAPEVAKLLPELRRLLPDIPPPLEMPPEQERRYLFKSVREFIDRASRVQPLLLLLEDLHWGDDASLLLFQHVAQHLNQMPVLVLGTYRDTELDVTRPLARALEELVRQRLVHDLALKRLPEADVKGMLQALSSQEPPSSLVHEVCRETDGNPFFVEEVFKYLTEEGKLFDEQGRWRSDLRVSELDVPRGVRLVIGRRLERISEEGRRALATAAIIGRAFSFELLEALGEVEADALLDAVDEGERAHLITSVTDGREARFTFAHELIRQTLVSGLSLPRRQRLHLRVAEAIEKTCVRVLEDHAADLAHHLYQAGAAAEPQKTVRYLTLAGEQAMAAAAFEDALGHYENAVSLQPKEDRRGLAGLLFKRGLALRSLGRWEEALADWMQSLVSYEEEGDKDAVGDVSHEVSWQLAWANRPTEAVEVADRGLAAIGEQASASRCRLLGVVGMSLSSGGDCEGAERMIGQSVTLAERLGDESLLGLALDLDATHRFFHMQVRQLLESGRRASELLGQAGNLWDLVGALHYTQYALLYMGRLDEAGKAGHEAEELAARLGHYGYLITAREGNSWTELALTGDIERFQRQIEEVLDLAVGVGFAWAYTYYHYLGDGHFWSGRWPEAVERYEEASRLEQPGMLAGLAWSGLFLARAYAGDKMGALALLQNERGSIARAGRANTLGAWLAMLAVVEGLAVLEERHEAARLYPVALDAVDTGAVVVPPRLTQNAAGIAATAGRRWEEAERHFGTALRQAHEIPVVIQQPEVRRWYARMLIDRNSPGDREKARQLLTEAITMYRQIGMPKHVEMAEAMLGGI
jgi:class 3 adenylate cyclase/tetratricopeptide (TPR) repeat protein